MKQVSIKDLKARLSEMVAAAQAGRTIVITRHNAPVAQLRPVRPAHLHLGRQAGTQRMKPAVRRATGGAYLTVLRDDRNGR